MMKFTWKSNYESIENIRPKSFSNFQILKLIPIIIPFDIQLLKPITKN